MSYFWRYTSELGLITMTSDGTALTGLWLEGQKGTDDFSCGKYMEKELTIFQETCHWLDRYFQGQDPGPIPLVSMEGTSFRKLVWQILQTIPYGQTVTYGQIAARVAAIQGKAQMSAQAVGGAVGHNPISIIVPCHRVIGTNGSLTGYAGGLDKKVKLLRLEGVEVSCQWEASSENDI